jgi:hypothetical protein
VLKTVKKGLRPGRKNVGLCVTAWGAVRVMVAFCLRLIAGIAKAEAINGLSNGVLFERQNKSIIIIIIKY